MDSNEPRLTQHTRRGPKRKAAKIVAVLLGLAIVAGLGYRLLAERGGGWDVKSVQTATVKRGDLIVSVVEGGTVQAMDCLKVASKAEAPWYPGSDYKRTITAIVDEGTVITEQDVEEGMVLVRLDSSDLKESEAQMQIWFYMSEFAYTQARENCEIQRKQNESDIAIAKLNVRFNHMELERYLGADLAAQVVEEKGGFADLADDPGLGGAAGQTLRTYKAQVGLATEELSQAEERLRWTRQLCQKEYTRPTELMADELSVNRRKRKLEAAKEDLRLFKRYTLPKESKQRYSWHAESIRELARTEARTRSRLAQAEANLKSSKASYELAQKRLQKTRDNFEKCTIRAPKPGPVVYASTGQPWREPVQEGTRLWQNQSIILIPVLSTLAARVNIHETDIEKVKLGQPALISVEAMPGQHFTGTVANIGSVASLAQAQTNPELRVYEVDVALNEAHEGLNPGMTATAEIIVAHRNDVLYVPIEALAAHNGQWVCSVAGTKGSEFRRIDTGHITENFVEVKQGLSEGEVVYLRPPVELPGGPGPDSGAESIPTVTVARGDFTVSVTQRAAIYSMEPLELKSEVEDWMFLLEVVDEGTLITEKDVEEGLVLARLDSSPLEEQEANRQIGLYGAEAAHVQARENYEIRQKYNESDIALAELNAEFGRIELDRYLSADVAAQVLEEKIDFGNLSDDSRLGGVARQELRNYESQMELAAEELLRAEERVRWSQKLYENEYVSRNELTADELSVTRRTAKLEAAQEDLRLFKRYAVRKRAEQRYSDCVELARELERVEARARSRLAQAEAQLRSAEAAYELEKERLEKVREKIEKCTICASKPGQVIYGSRSDPIWYRTGDSALRPGAGIEENRTIIRIPDPSTLGALVNIPEADIQKVEVGQPARISLAAAPGTVLAGRVARISPMASAEQAWINPEAKVYETEVALTDMPEHFIPGMSATVEIIVAELEDVLYVPRQAVTQYKGRSICWVKGPEGPEPYMVETGHSSDLFIEIKSGVRAGEKVYLAPPRDMDEGLIE